MIRCTEREMQGRKPVVSVMLQVNELLEVLLKWLQYACHLSSSHSIKCLRSFSLNILWQQSTPTES